MKGIQEPRDTWVEEEDPEHQSAAARLTGILKN